MQAGKGDDGAEWSSNDPDPSWRPGKRKAEEKRRWRNWPPNPPPFSVGPGDRLEDPPPLANSPLLVAAMSLLTMPRRPRGGVDMEKGAVGTVNSISLVLFESFKKRLRRGSRLSRLPIYARSPLLAALLARD